MKEIILPEGFEIDFDKSTKDRVILKAVEEKKLPEKVEDLAPQRVFLKNSDNNPELSGGVFYPEKLGFVSEKAFRSSEAKRLLGFLLKEYNGDWEPDWSSKTQTKYILCRVRQEIEMDRTYTIYYFLAFPTPELRYKFLSHFERLIKDYFEMD